MASMPQPPRKTANPAPPRPAGSLRRTSSLDVEWPDGRRGTRRMHGRARDYRTNANGAGTVLAEATMTADLDPQRMIIAISAEALCGPVAPANITTLIGKRGGGHLRMAIQELMPELIAQTAPLYLALDDISGTSLISSWAWSLWDPDWLAKMREQVPERQSANMMQEMMNVCWGLAEGNSGLNPDAASMSQPAADGGELRNPADPDGWHRFPEIAGVSFRRARRIDLWREGGLIHIDAAFQDSAPREDGTRAALHEYRIAATADAETLELLTLEPEGRVLPFFECPGAIANARALVGSSLDQMRATVLGNLRGTAGCTHLNDALRALADVPQLAKVMAEAA